MATEPAVEVEEVETEEEPLEETVQRPDLSEATVDERHALYAEWRDKAQLSVVMIGRDARMFLPESLTRLAGDCHEVIYMDTGSTDISKRQAYEFGCKVYETVWRQSFAAARNEALSKATGKWILSLDTDEVIERDELRKLNFILAKSDPETESWFTILEMVNDKVPLEGDMNFQLRVFPNLYARGLRWKFRVHEQIRDGLEELGIGEPLMSHVRIRHLGYANQDLVKVKCSRNRELLQMELEEGADRPRFIAHYHMAKCAAALGSHNESLDWVRKVAHSEEAMEKNQGQVVAAYEFWGTILMRTQQPELAIKTWQEARQKFPEDPIFPAHIGLARHALGETAEAVELLTLAADMPMTVRAQAGSATRLQFAAMKALAEIFERRAFLGTAGPEERRENETRSRMWAERAERLIGATSQLATKRKG